MMRVIAGSARGTKLLGPRNLSARPTADRVREALFNIICPLVPGAFFVDLFAGSGAIGIEALSRGADCCIFVDNSRLNLDLVQKNLTRTKLVAKARLFQGDAAKTINRLAAENTSTDLIYIDPPYGKKMVEPVLKSIRESGILAPGGMIVVEHPATDRDLSRLFPDARRKQYGNTALTFIQPEMLDHMTVEKA